MKATNVTYHSSGAQSAPQAMNTAPSLAAAQSIGGFGPARNVAVTGPKHGPGPGGISSANQGGPGYGTMHSGPSNPGALPVEGTQCPKFGPGPSGIGESGSFSTL